MKSISTVSNNKDYENDNEGNSDMNNATDLYSGTCGNEPNKVENTIVRYSYYSNWLVIGSN